MKNFAPLILLICLFTALPAQTGQLAGLALFDYRQAAPGTVTLQAYHQFVLEFCAREQPARLMLYVTSPETFDYYKVDSTTLPEADAGNYLGFLQQFSQQCPETDLEVMIDRSSFPATASETSLPGCWQGLPGK